MRIQNAACRRNPFWARIEINAARDVDGAPLCRVVASDISEHKRIEKALKESERFAQSTVDALTTHLAILDETGTIVAVNSAWRQFARANSANSACVAEGANYLDVCDKATGVDSMGAAKCAVGIRAILNGMRDRFTLEYPCHSPTEKRWFVGRVTRFLGEGSPRLVVVAHEDITERKLAEDALRHANRALHVLSESNSMLVRTADEETLLREVCRIITETGGYRLSCVAFAEHDENRTVRVAAQHGFKEGYLDSYKITWHDTEYGQGPTGTAIRTGQITYFADIPHDPRFVPWREKAQQYGYASSIAFPIVIEGETVGALMVCADMVNAFSDDEIANLGRLTDNLSLGLRILRTHADRDRVDQARRESEERFRVLFESSHDAIMTLEPPLWRFTSANQATVDMFKTGSKEGFLSCAPWNLSPERQPDGRDSPTAVRIMIETAMREGTHTFEWTHKRVGGETFPAIVSLTRMEQAGKSFLEATVRDVTYIKRAEAALRESEERFRLASLYSNDLIYERDLRTGVAQYFGDVDLALGYAPGEFPRTLAEWVEHIHIEDLSLLMDAYQEGYRYGKPYDVEYRVRKKDGTYAHWSDTGCVILDAAGNPLKNIGAATDITERKQAEAALLASESRFRAITNSARDAILMMDAESRISHWNPAAEHILGYTSAEALGQNLHELIAPKSHREAHRAAFPEFQRTGRGAVVGKTLELPALRKDGREIAVALSLSAVQLSGGWHAVGILRNISESKRMMEDLIQAKTEADRANRAKSTFLANMSHEICTPMNAILGFSQLLQRDKALTTQQSEYLHVINRSGEHLLALINDILETSKIEAGRVELNMATFDLAVLLDDMEMMFRVRTDAKMLWLEFNHTSEVPRFVQADEGKVRQILINMLGNAVKFTDAGGIVVRVRAQDEDGNRVRIVIEVEDSGCGIAHEELTRVFGIFEQAQNALNRGGTGLGMSISQQYARMMGGDLTVESEKGKGAVFRVEFQAVRRREMDIPVARIQNRVVGLIPGQKAIRVLVVDDRVENRELLVHLLTQVGFLIREARDGAEAVAMFEEWHPHAIFLDMRMPGMDGQETARRIKALPSGLETPVIAISASAMEEDQAAILAAGISGFIRKPFREEEIFEALRRFTGVGYVYEEPKAVAQSPDESSFALSREAIHSLPPDLVAAMYDAIAAARMDEFLKLAKKAGEHAPKVSGMLCILAQQFNYDRLLDLLEGERDGAIGEQGEVIDA